MKTIYRFLFAGGGTGGHLYPAVAVAQQIKMIKPESEILFIGAKGKMESRIVPKLGFNFKSIWISGFTRKFSIDNILFPLKLLVSLSQSLFYCIKFHPQVAIGSGAYVSGPVIWSASILGSRILLMEQNSYPGLTNRLLEKKADQIHITFEDSKNYFRDKSKLKLSGNPVRINLELIDKSVALEKFQLSNAKKTLLILGGSGGALSINEAVKNNLINLLEKNIQIIWQTGSFYFERYKHLNSADVKVVPFIDDMAVAYSAADLLVARAGATTIAEASYLGLPVIFVPSTNVAANHQYKNAITLKNNDAAEIVEDSQVNQKIVDKIMEIIFDENKLKSFSQNIKKFSKPNAAKNIALDAIKLAETFNRD
ncbi:undecaprenyldiphospho-muramoylpentapeptide beta-N-acetylglucosaminyltransferase [Melioribacteraceae bacterium 4301-Me]|uniref:undecaprenyldiphospho-muramoylpentapeptide beta-N-acetylglucosaminyltransferase n=1 Tax=Pyranulibacter aquaticus TaxID=3163344 RepID=UPI0035958B6C